MALNTIIKAMRFSVPRTSSSAMCSSSCFTNLYPDCSTFPDNCTSSLLHSMVNSLSLYKTERMLTECVSSYLLLFDRRHKLASLLRLPGALRRRPIPCAVPSLRWGRPCVWRLRLAVRARLLPPVPGARVLPLPSPEKPYKPRVLLLLFDYFFRNNQKIIKKIIKETD